MPLCCGAHQLNGMDVWGTLVLWSTSAQWDRCVGYPCVVEHTSSMGWMCDPCVVEHNSSMVWVSLCCGAHQLNGMDVWGTLVLWSTSAQWDGCVGYPCVVEHISSMG